MKNLIPILFLGLTINFLIAFIWYDWAIIGAIVSFALASFTAFMINDKHDYTGKCLDTYFTEEEHDNT